MLDVIFIEFNMDAFELCENKKIHNYASKDFTFILKPKNLFVKSFKDGLLAKVFLKSV